MGWVSPTFHFTINHKSGKHNQGADASSQRYLLLFQLDACVLGFKHLKAFYANDEDFGELFTICSKNPNGDFFFI